MFDDAVRFPATPPTPPEPPTPPIPPDPPPTTPELQPSEAAGSRQAEFDQLGQAWQLRLTGDPTEGPPIVPPTPDEQARAAAAQVEQAFNDNPNVIITAPGQGRDPNQPWAQEAAAQTLADVTAAQTSEVAALTIHYAQPTIDRISIELGRTAQEQDGGYGDDRPDFDGVVNNLAAAANNAAAAPGGQAAVDAIATSVVRNINPDDVGRFDEAFGKPVQNGTGGELSAAVIRKLQAAGRTDQADDILQNVEDGINSLHDRAGDLAEDVAKYNEELGWLVDKWRPQMSEDQLNAAIEGYKRENPEYARALEELDRIGVAQVRAIDSFGNARADFAGLDHADDVEGALVSFLNDEKTKSVVAQSPGAIAEVDRLLQAAENNPAESNFFDDVASIAGKIDDGNFLTETVLNKALDATLQSTYDAARVRDLATVDRQIARLERYADTLGYNTPGFRNILQQYGRIARAENQQEVETALRVLARKVDSFQSTNPGVFTDENQFADKFKRFGLVLGAVGTGASIYQAIDDPTALNIAGGLVDAAGLTTEVAQTQVVTNLLRNRAWFQGLPVEALGKVFGGLSLALDAYSIVSSIQKGDYVDAGLGVAGAAGGVMILLPAASTGVGLLLVGGALIGKFIWSGVQEANKHETDGARAFLEGAGIDPEVANELINNDSDGRSPAPVFTALAEHLGVDPHEYFDYLSHLSPDEVNDLIETAHGVDPNDDGVYPVELHTEYVNPRYPIPSRPDDLNDLADWMRENGYANAPGL